MRWIWFLCASVSAFSLIGCKPGDRIVARADGVTVTAEELQESLWQRYGQVMVRELLQRKLIKREAQKRGIVVDEKEVSQELKRLNLSDTHENRERVRSELLLKKLAEAMVEVTEAEARQYYEENKHLYEFPERVRLRDITLESRQNAEAIWEALRLRKGDNFAELARHFSVNPATRQRGGDMGLIPLRELHPKLQAVVKRLKVGEFSEPVEVNGEWVIVKLEGRIPAQRKTFEEVRDQIIAQLKQQKAWQMKLELAEKLLKRAEIQILDPSLKEQK